MCTYTHTLLYAHTNTLYISMYTAIKNKTQPYLYMDHTYSYAYSHTVIQ